MADTINIVAEGEEAFDDRPGNKVTSRWLLAAILGGVALVFFLFGAESFSRAPLPPESDRLSVGVPTVGVRAVVPGFPDGIVAVSTTDGLMLDLTVWPATRPNYETSLSLETSAKGGRVRLDASGRRIAMLQRTRDGAENVLIAGMPEAARVVDVDVTGHAWHDSAAGFLAYTTVEDNELLLWIMAVSMSEPELLSRGIGPDGGLVAWGDWGFALQDEAGTRVTLLSPQGEITRLDAGRFLDSHIDGSLVIAGDEVKVYGAVEGIRGFGGRFAQVGDLLTAKISPDGRSLAVLGNAGLLVLPFAGDSMIEQAVPRHGVAQIEWSSDSRFVLVPATQGLSVLDTISGELTFLLEDRTILGLSVLVRTWP